MSGPLALISSSLFALVFALSAAHAQTPAAPPASGCEAKAISSSGKPLAGPAKSSFMKKCEADSAATK